ncbi:hypothetical protein GJ744_002244 [Endocarpon pusillum]|uniref:Heterokaryon incompatibility domain-containing protein n=1 Tax=Endocarpon pusillum TaxID=364733 RepID=A0A8H7AFW4_9EURO|nr:hypothetical protein GJ744_002244 [Endocarpon pusillum]
MIDSTVEEKSPVSATHECYSYGPLSTEMRDEMVDALSPESTIRLLHLFPGTGSDPLECSLEEVAPFVGAILSGDLQPLFCEEHMPQERTYYEALSYVWGDVTKSENLVCDKKILKITASLAAALRAVRWPKTLRTLWADGICINQQDKDERASQVLLMSSIYSQAAQVICWLGDDDVGGHASFTFSLADRFATKTELASINTDGLATVDIKTVFGAEPSIVTQTWGTEDRDLHTLLHLIIENIPGHIAALLHRPWFSRMWIRQEVGYASKALVMCGDSEVDCKALYWLLVWAVQFDEASKMFLLPTWSLSALESYCRTPLKPFLELLVEYRQFESTDPRDKVFALLSHPSAWMEIELEGEKDYCVDVLAAMQQRAGRELVADELAKARDQLWQDLSRHSDIELAQLSREKAKHIAHIFNQLRRLDELENPRLLPVKRIGKGSNLFAGCSRRILDPNYRQSISDINYELAIRFMAPDLRAALRLLCTVQHEPSRMTALQNEHATWVPRWDRSDIHCQLGFHSSISHGFCPWGPVKVEMKGTVANKVFSLEGILIDTISALTEPISALTDPTALTDPLTDPSRSYNSPHREAVLGLWHSILGLNLLPSVETNVQKLRSYCRVLTANNFERPRPFSRFIFPRLDDAGLFDSFAAYWLDLHKYNYNGALVDPSAMYSLRIFRVPDELKQGARRATNKDFADLALRVSRNRRLFSTQRGFLGLGPQILESGDVVCIFPDTPVPLVLRPVDDYFLLVGECYVDGIMDGEEAEAAKIRTIELH